MRWRNGTFGAPALIAVLTAGCAKTADVKGRVTLDGQPVVGATVLFVPEPGNAARPASGLTDSDGNFRLTTYRSDDGAVPGAYRIVVRKTKSFPEPDPKHTGKNKPRERLPRIAARKEEKPFLPPIYGDPAKTPLRCTVPAADVVSLELSSTSK
ncbi:MAG TPA: carboxypeptidase-like regulatory domain-containing protein [Gemmataceae bacterium]|jgi:hypothetical protein